MRIEADKARGRYTLRYVDTNGRRRSKVFDTREQAESFRASLLGAQAITGLGTVKSAKERGSASWWHDIHVQLAERLVASKDAAELRLTADTIKAFAECARSATQWVDATESERLLEKLQARIDELTGASTRGARIRQGTPARN